MKTKHILMTFALLLSTTFLNATVYEEGTGINSWSIYDTAPAGASITSIYDTERASDVIKLEGTNSKNGYMLGSWSGTNAWNNTTEKTLTWSMNYTEDYYIFVSMQTTKGHRYLYYSNAGDDRGLFNKQFIHYGLGASTIDGTWQTISRDLEADLKKYESDNSIVSVNAFLVRGSGLFDDIKLTNNTEMNELMTYYTVKEDVTVIPTGGHITNINIYKHNLDTNITVKTIDGYETDSYDGLESDGFKLLYWDTMSIDNVTYILIASQTSTIKPSHSKYELWKTDGTKAGTIKLSEMYYTVSSDSYEDSYAKLTSYTNGKLHLFVYHINYKYDDKRSYDLWETDGTVAGTVKIKTIFQEGQK